jgi:hypothetical protein
MHSSGKNQESDIHCVIPEPQIGSRSCSISQLSSIRWLCGSDTRVNGDAVHRQKTGEYRIWWRRTASSNYNRGTLCCNTSTSHTSFTSFTFHLSFSFTEFTVCKSFSLKHCLTLFSLQLFFHSNTLSSVTSNQSHKYVEERHIVLIANSWPHLLPCTFCSHGDDCFAHAARLPSVRPLCVCTSSLLSSLSPFFPQQNEIDKLTTTCTSSQPLRVMQLRISLTVYTFRYIEELKQIWIKVNSTPQSQNSTSSECKVAERERERERERKIAIMFVI